jgi:hypothetical protein
VSFLLPMMIAVSGPATDDGGGLRGSLIAYRTCIAMAAERFSPLVRTSGPRSGIESAQVADRAMAACLEERKTLKEAAIAAMRSKPEYRERTDLDAQAEAALQPFDAEFKEDARMSALLAFANRK